MGVRLQAAVHELGCPSCRVTWRSWAQRLIGFAGGHNPHAEAFASTATWDDHRPNALVYATGGGADATLNVVVVTCEKQPDAIADAVVEALDAEVTRILRRKRDLERESAAARPDGGNE